MGSKLSHTNCAKGCAIAQIIIAFLLLGRSGFLQGTAWEICGWKSETGTGLPTRTSFNTRQMRHIDRLSPCASTIGSLVAAVPWAVWAHSKPGNRNNMSLVNICASLVCKALGVFTKHARGHARTHAHTQSISCSSNRKWIWNFQPKDYAFFTCCGTEIWHFSCRLHK